MMHEHTILKLLNKLERGEITFNEARKEIKRSLSPASEQDTIEENVPILVRIPEAFRNPVGFDDMKSLTNYIDGLKLAYVLQPNSLSLDEAYTVASIMGKTDIALSDDRTFAGISAIDSFVEALEYGVYPPYKVLLFFYDAFKRYIKDGGETRLDQLLGLAYSGRGKTRGFDVVNKKRRNDHDCFRMHVLMEVFGFSQNQAAEMIVAQYQQLKDQYSEEDIEIHDDSYFKKLYRESNFNGNPTILGQLPTGSRFQNLLNDNKKQLDFLNAYPTKHLNPRTKDKLSALLEELKRQTSL